MSVITSVFKVCEVFIKVYEVFMNTPDTAQNLGSPTMLQKRKTLTVEKLQATTNNKKKTATTTTTTTLLLLVSF